MFTDPTFLGFCVASFALGVPFLVMLVRQRLGRTLTGLVLTKGLVSLAAIATLRSTSHDTCLSIPSAAWFALFDALLTYALPIGVGRVARRARSR